MALLGSRRALRVRSRLRQSFGVTDSGQALGADHQEGRLNEDAALDCQADRDHIPFQAGMRKLGAYIDKILKGARPGDIPIEQMSEHELIIEMRVARAARIVVPQGLLIRADRVIR